MSRLKPGRRERKFILSDEKAEAIRRFVRAYLPPDPHMNGNDPLGYHVRTLYLDTPQLELYRRTVDGKKNYSLRRQGYEGLQIRECGLFWYWARGGKTRLEQGRHLLQLSAPADGSKFGALVLTKAPPDLKAFEALLDNLFLNRSFRPWLSD